MPFLGGTSYQNEPKRAFEAKRKTIGPHLPPSMKPYEPSWNERIGGKIADWVTEGNKSNVGRREWGNTYSSALETVTPLDAIEGGVKAAKRGDWSEVAGSAAQGAVENAPWGKGLKVGGVFTSALLKPDSGAWNTLLRRATKGRGFGSEGANLESKASQMLKQGYSEEDVLKETGISYARSKFGLENKLVPQMEISGRDMRWNPVLPEMDMTNVKNWNTFVRDPDEFKYSPKVGDVVQWPGFFGFSKVFEKFKNKPLMLETDPMAAASLLNVKGSKMPAALVVNPKSWGKGGQVSEYPKDALIDRNSTIDTIGHEFGHVPQRILSGLGWSQGADPAMFFGANQMPPNFFVGNEKLIEGLHGRFAQNPNPWFQDLTDQIYFDTAGETNARTGAIRMAFDAPNMRAELPSKTASDMGWAGRHEQIPTEAMQVYMDAWNKLDPATQNAFWNAMPGMGKKQ